MPTYKKTMELDKHIMISLHPELISASFKKNEADLFIAWTIMKTLDTQKAGSGHLSLLNDMLPLFVGLFNIKTSQAYLKLEEGVGKYWNPPAGKRGERTTSLISNKKVIQYLSPTMARVSPFVFEIRHLFSRNKDLEGWKYLRPLLISIVAARFIDTRPVSYATIQEHTGLSRSTINRNLKACPHLNIIENHYEVSVHDNYLLAANELNRMVKISGRHDNPWFVSGKIDGKYCIMRQMPNSYILGIDRGPVRQRPKELKVFDKVNAEHCSERRYFENKKVAYNKNEGFVSVGNIKFDGDTVFIWNNLENSD